MPERLKQEILEELNDAWLNISVNKDQLIRPLDILDSDDPDIFYKKLTWLMTNPDYFAFLCKHIFNIELLPFQSMILKELYNRRFPMLIASRGAGKTFLMSLYCLLRALLMPNRKIVVVGAAFRQSKFLHDYMENIWKNSPILRDICDSNSGPRRDVDMCRMLINGSNVTALPIGDGCVSPYTQTTYDNCFGYIVDKKDSVWGNGRYRNIDYNIDNGVKPTKIITTKKGFNYEGTHNHAMKVLRDEKVDWVRTDQMKVGDRILIDRSERWHNGSFECTEDGAYALGAMIGDGCWTNKYRLRFATKDQEIINRINLSLDNKFVQCKDEVHWDRYGVGEVSEWLDFWKLKDGCCTKDKTLPQTILSASQDAMTACLQGLFDTDGHVFVDESRGGITTSVNFTNTSKRLVEQIQYILLHYGIVSKVSSRDRSDKWNTVYELGIYGTNVKLFAEKIGFHLSRKQNKLLEAVSKKRTWNSFDDDIPLDGKIIADSVDRTNKVPHKFCESRIVRKKSFQQKYLREILPYCNNPSWSDLVNSNIFYDTIVSIEDSESHTYDIHVPEGNEYCANGFFSHNSKIRGQRANDIISDEFASMSLEIFENVIAGFAAVAASPAEGVRLYAAKKKAKELGVDPFLYLGGKEKNDVGNQIVLAGTAYYDFNHFATYWKRWKSIIKSKGDKKKLREIFGEEVIPESFDWRDYSVTRIPVDLIPKGFMDEAQIARSKATVHNGIYLMEFGAVFCTDSAGFFKRSLIESCVGTDLKPVHLLSGNDVFFDSRLKGDVAKPHIIGVDPASEVDNFSIVVLELNDDHRRIVYCWTTNRKQHKERVKMGLTNEHDFYSYCARKIRDLMNLFPTIHVAMDSQGGGIAVSEALHDPKNLKQGEVPIWPVIDKDKKKDTDFEAGNHILELCNFAKYDWLSEANHGLRKDFEDKMLIFPRFDPITIGLSLEEDKAANRKYDTLEDCVMEIEELKNELSMIEITQTSSGRERWDTPEIKVGVGKKERIRKDRYSSLLMANMAARQERRSRFQDSYEIGGGFAEIMDSKKPRTGADFITPGWIGNKLDNLYG